MMNHNIRLMTLDEWDEFTRLAKKISEFNAKKKYGSDKVETPSGAANWVLTDNTPAATPVIRGLLSNDPAYWDNQTQLAATDTEMPSVGFRPVIDIEGDEWFDCIRPGQIGYMGHLTLNGKWAPRGSSLTEKLEENPTGTLALRETYEDDRKKFEPIIGIRIKNALIALDTIGHGLSYNAITRLIQNDEPKVNYPENIDDVLKAKLEELERIKSILKALL